MRLLQCGLLAVAVFGLTGCGTIHNLSSAPKGNLYVATNTCYPFGGVTRSGILAAAGPTVGVVGIVEGNIAICQGEFGRGFEQIGSGTLLTVGGLGAIVDTPLSLAGDIITLPIAYARHREYPWATWWGEESCYLTSPIDSETNDTRDDSVPPTPVPANETEQPNP